MVRLAVHRAPTQPPFVRELRADGPAELVEAAFTAAAEVSCVPPLAVREVVENLIHAGFADALVSVLHDGRTVRVSDTGPGIADRERALQPGFSTATADERVVIRGVGCGLPLAAAVLAERGGRLEIAENLGGGAVVTLELPESAGGAAPPSAPDGPDEGARMVLALLLELGGAGPERLAGELGIPLAECGRELVLLEHRGLVAREPGGARSLTEAGRSLVATLF
ncbi:MAG: hypothetical protein QOD86_556 [Miltoncostaeaceae bacterium]|jgi:hypothetical protein|nr:hypothetical protein [Miltoncostaeaceae bacterium]